MVKITGIGWRLKFYFFLDFVVPINSMLQHTSSPPPSLPRALDYSLCPRSRHLKKKAFSRVGYLNVTRVRQGIWTRIVKSFQWNKMSFFFFDEEYGNLNKPIFRSSNTSGVTQGGGDDVEALYWLTHSVERHSEKVFLEQQRKLCTSLCEATKALNPNNCPTRDICILYPSQKRMHLWEQTCFRSQSWAKASSLYLGKKGTEPVRKQQMQSKIVFLQK